MKPTCPPFTKDKCPCWDYVDYSKKYCWGNCCNKNLIETKINNNSIIVQYGTEINDYRTNKKCYYRYNDNIQEIDGLTEFEYQICNNDVIRAIEKSTCSISETYKINFPAKQSLSQKLIHKFNEFKEYINESKSPSTFWIFMIVYLITLCISITFVCCLCYKGINKYNDYKARYHKITINDDDNISEIKRDINIC